MLAMSIGASRSSPGRVLCMGAHCDDIEIGAGATVRLLQSGPAPVVFDWVVFSGDDDRRREAIRAMELLVAPGSRGTLRFGAFPDGRFPAVYGEIKAFCESLKELPRPDLILCHERDDRHQDHRVVNEMVWNTFRDHLVLEFEIPKWDGGLGQPNVYVPVTEADARAKVDALMAAFASQRNRDWFTPESFLGLMRLRGMECRSASGYAEAFHGRKIRFSGF